MLKIALALVLACLSIQAEAGSSLRFATSGNNPPFEYLNDRNQLVGFDIDLANALCQRLKRSCLFTNNTFDRLLPSLKYHHDDAIISGMDITDERQNEVDFTQPYIGNSSLMVVPKGRFWQIAQLKGKRVGVRNLSTQQAYLRDRWPEIIAVTYDSYQNALLDISKHRLDGIIGDTVVIRSMLKVHPQLATVGGEISDSRYFDNGMGIAVRKGDDELLNALNQALQSLTGDGTVRRLALHWFEPAQQE
ncbi:transporter substrate-binding domain-containing protein [Erwinia sp. ErVv1]|uniref:transporter substrate-binding domain-containing protein n=1 Tax=Erwinia sp. ErVv1 TaxID=1603299 RepID=UPI0008314EB8|nr:transporter substrate-binding domain-containing protein [Erwinia sp. ErVv1]